MSNSRIQETSTETKEEIIFKCADSLFKISQTIHGINKDISDTILLLSDRLLKEIEIKNNEEKVEDKSQVVKKIFPIKSKDDPSKFDVCIDCGGIKQEKVIHKDTCPDCGGIKHSENVPSHNVSEASNQCNGHTNRPGVVNENVNSQKIFTPVIENEIKSLIEEIRKGL